jgi:hypothetical protein
MHTLNWPRIILCGLIAGVVFTLATLVLMGAVGRGLFAAASTNAAAGDGARGVGLGLYLVTVATGIWAMWLYAIVLRWFTNRWKAAVVAGLAWWLIASLQSLKWIFLLRIPTAAWLPLTANIAVCIVATLVGAALFGAVATEPPGPGDALI